MVVDGIFQIKGRGWCITGLLDDRDKPELGDFIIDGKTYRVIGKVRGIEGSINNFNEFRVQGIVISQADRPEDIAIGDLIRFRYR